MTPGTASQSRVSDATPAVLDLEVDAASRRRWDEIQRLFERCRCLPRDAWHRVLREECAGRESLAFEVLTLLVADEQLPPLEPDAHPSSGGAGVAGRHGDPASAR